MPGQFAQGGVTMRDCLKNRAGFDRVLMTVAATFLTVSATSALAQADPARSSAAELAIDAAIPRPEPANLPPPTIDDSNWIRRRRCRDAAKTDAPKATEPKTTEKPADTKPAESSRLRPPTRTRTTARMTPASEDRDHHNRTCATAPAPPRRQRRLRARQGAGQGRQQRPAGGPASGRQVARNAGREIIALFRPQGRARRG